MRRKINEKSDFLPASEVKLRKQESKINVSLTDIRDDQLELLCQHLPELQ